eukprot:1186816-Pyramimonas_sp.AAC.1
MRMTSVAARRGSLQPPGTSHVIKTASRIDSRMRLSRTTRSMLGYASVIYLQIGHQKVANTCIRKTWTSSSNASSLSIRHTKHAVLNIARWSTAALACT